jgi:hypothetical protein
MAQGSGPGEPLDPRRNSLGLTGMIFGALAGGLAFVGAFGVTAISGDSALAMTWPIGLGGARFLLVPLPILIACRPATGESDFRYRVAEAGRSYGSTSAPTPAAAISRLGPAR